MSSVACKFSSCKIVPDVPLLGYSSSSSPPGKSSLSVSPVTMSSLIAPIPLNLKQDSDPLSNSPPTNIPDTPTALSPSPIIKGLQHVDPPRRMVIRPQNVFSNHMLCLVLLI
ncbi:hypothetical protein M5689_019059 [Euphorbia peplus]|nr:hypothetical protein M5689_019059 [Euphorbia peplus]